jgi:hypothetical protein
MNKEVRSMAGREFDTFLLTDPKLVPEDEEKELILRDLAPEDRRRKYRSFFARAQVSKSKSKHPDTLWIRLGRGQLLEEPWSVKIIEELNKFSD